MGYRITQGGISEPTRREQKLKLLSELSKHLLMEEVSLVNYTVKSFLVSCERFSYVLPLGWTSSLLHSLINCILCLGEDSPLLLFPGVNEMRTKVTLSPTRLFAPFWGGLAPPSSGSSTVVLGLEVPPQFLHSSRRVFKPVQLQQLLSKLVLLYLHTEQTGNCVHLYANVFVPKAEILN